MKRHWKHITLTPTHCYHKKKKAGGHRSKVPRYVQQTTTLCWRAFSTHYNQRNDFPLNDKTINRQAHDSQSIINVCKHHSSFHSDVITLKHSYEKKERRKPINRPSFYQVPWPCLLLTCGAALFLFSQHQASLISDGALAGPPKLSGRDAQIR